MAHGGVSLSRWRPTRWRASFNSTFDHRGRKSPLPFATEADVQGVLSVTPWQARPALAAGVDHPLPLAYLLAGGETAFKARRAER